MRSKSELCKPFDSKVADHYLRLLHELDNMDISFDLLGGSKISVSVRMLKETELPDDASEVLIFLVRKWRDLPAR
jgi:hypothetical protein